MNYNFFYVVTGSGNSRRLWIPSKGQTPCEAADNARKKLDALPEFRLQGHKYEITHFNQGLRPMAVPQIPFKA